MKTIFTLSFWLAVIFSVPTGVALAQDSTRVPDVNADANASVDATAHAEVHAGTDDQSKQQPQPLGQTNKHQQKGATKWTLQPSDQPSSTRFQTAQPTKPTLETDRSDSKALFNPLTRTETPPNDDAAPGKNQSQGVSSTRANQPLGSKPQPDTQAAARQKLLDSLNNNAPPPSSKSWNSPVNAFLTRRRDQPRRQPPRHGRSLRQLLSRRYKTVFLSQATRNRVLSIQIRKSANLLDPTLRDKPGSALDSRSSPN